MADNAMSRPNSRPNQECKLLPPFSTFFMLSSEFGVFAMVENGNGREQQDTPRVQCDGELEMSHMIRPATVKDVERMVSFNERLAQEIDGKELASDVVHAAIHAQFRDPRLGQYFVACDGQEVVGQCRIWSEYHDWSAKPVFWFDNVFSAKRRSGIFAALFQHVHSAAKTAGVEKLRLHVSKSNLVARHVYQRLGFKAPSEMMELDIEMSPRFVHAIEEARLSATAFA